LSHACSGEIARGPLGTARSGEAAKTGRMVDSLDQAFAPGTETPEVGGLSSADASVILKECFGLDVVGGDVVEVAPHNQYDADRRP
jgi:Arginase family